MTYLKALEIDQSQWYKNEVATFHASSSMDILEQREGPRQELPVTNAGPKYLSLYKRKAEELRFQALHSSQMSKLNSFRQEVFSELS
jgi:hypothetical protein